MAPAFDVVIRNGAIYDGSGAAAVAGDVAIHGDRIAAIGTVHGDGRIEIEADGLAVAPGFINMLSWANVSLIADGRSQSDIRQGVTLEVLGEGTSMGPLNAAMRQFMIERQGDITYDVTWTTLGEYLEHLVRRGVSTNVASFVGATTVRIHELGYANRAPKPRELERMRALVRRAMEEGALGMSSALIYPPAAYCDTEELIALAEVVAEYGGMYISHIRNEEARIHDALDEFLTIARTTGVTAEIYHLKVSGQENWDKLPSVIKKIESARAAELPITADMYPYTASSTGLDTAIPGWAHEGGLRALVRRLRDPATRERIKQEMTLFTEPEGVIVVRFRSDSLKPLIGKTLAEVAAMRRQSWQDAVMDLIAEDDNDIGAVFFTMSEENVRREIALPWVGVGSDGGSYSAEGVFLRSGTHPRAYGTFARVLGKYVREEKVIPLKEAIRRMTSFPAANLKLDRRGTLAPGYFADVVVFDPSTIRDHATYQQPHQYATGVAYVFVNGVQVLTDGEPAGAKSGRVTHGPGWRG